jgi:hypothetical protein
MNWKGDIEGSDCGLIWGAIQYFLKW